MSYFHISLRVLAMLSINIPICCMSSPIILVHFSYLALCLVISALIWQLELALSPCSIF